jgi:TonB family protein
MELAPLTVLNKRFTVKRTMGDPGPYDIAYLGEDNDSDKSYFIREFFPTHLVDRAEGETSVQIPEDSEEAELLDSGMEYYRKESTVLQEVSHEVIPSGYEMFEANGTVYRVRPHQSSMSLRKGLNDKGALSEKAALTIMVPILKALHEAHENGLYHGGVSPRTIRLLGDGQVLLTNFRGALIQLARDTGHLSDLVQPGTSAVEQYTPRGNQGPWTDVYGAAATICQMVTGESLPESTDRLEGEDPLESILQDANVFSAPGVREALIEALTVDPSQRLQSAEALVDALTASSTRYDEDADSYSIASVGPDEDDEEPAAEASDEDDEVEVLSAEGEGDRSARASSSSRSTAEDESGGGRTALLVGIPILLLAAAGGTWFMMGSGSSSGAAGSSYEEYRQQADSLFQAENYDRAEFFYNRALNARGDDEYVEQRLQKLAELQQSSDEARYSQRMDRGDRLRTEADSLYEAEQYGAANQTYSQAMASYLAAQEIRPDASEVQQKMSQIETRQEAIAKQQAGGGNESGTASLDQVANFFKQQGDRQLEAGNLRTALTKYRQALEYKPNNQQLQRAVSDLESQIQQQEQQESFREAYNRGLRLIRQENYEDALSAFEEAAQVRPNSQQLAEARARADSLLQARESQRQRYEELRSSGDTALDEGRFDDAVSAYQKALEIRPDDEYVQGRLEEAQREKEALEMAQAEQQEQQERREEIIGEDGIYKVVDQSPEVKGGLKTLTENASYPEAARRKGVEGRVYVRAVINKDGTVREAEIYRGLSSSTDEEALRVAREAEFAPAKYNGESVPARTTVWIQFKLEQ